MSSSITHPKYVVVNGLPGSKKKPHKCYKCKTTDDYHWRTIQGLEGEYCRDCYIEIIVKPEEGFALGGEVSDYTRKLRASLPKDEFLGPYNKQSGSRGIFKRYK